MKVFLLFIFLFIVTSFELKDFDSKNYEGMKNQMKIAFSKVNTTRTIIPFNCPRIPPSNPQPVDATKLRPSDIKVIMALGDSVTAGFAMNDESYSRSFFEYRGWSGLMGAESDTQSLVNFFKQVGADVKGGSMGRGLPFGAIRWPWPIRPHNPPVDKLNAAQSRARVEHLSEQIDYLNSQGRKEPGIDFNNDWKFLNIFIGGNNLFHCKEPEAQPDFFEKSIHEAIVKVNATIPKVFISLMPIFETAFDDLWNNGKDYLYCKFMWSLFRLECLLESELTRNRVKLLALAYNQRIYKIAEYWKIHRKQDLYVSVQPFLKKIHFPDLSWTSKFDCFHASLKTNEIFASTIWNSIQLPPEKKPTDLMTNIICPTSETLLQ